MRRSAPRSGGCSRRSLRCGAHPRGVRPRGVGAITLSLLPRSRDPVDRADLPRIALLGLVWMAVPLLLFPIGQQWIDSSLAGMINGAVPVFAAVTAAISLRRRPAGRQLLGIAIGFLGVVGVLWPATQGADVTVLGAGLVLLAVLCYGIAVNLAVPLQQRYGALPVLFRAQLVALVLLAPAALVSLPSSEFAWPSALAVMALGFFGTGWAFVAMTTLVGRVGAPVARWRSISCPSWPSRSAWSSATRRSPRSR